MTALQIASMKKFMAQLLTSDAFDDFLLEEATIKTGCTYEIDGHINKEFYNDGTSTVSGQENADIPAYDCCPWSEQKTLAFNLIKGRRTPLFFRFVLQYKPEKVAALLSAANCDVDPAQVKSLILNIRYDGSKAVITTGSSFTTFLLTREPDAIWDKAVCKLLESRDIEYEQL